MDLGEIVSTARRLLDRFERAQVVQGDLLSPPFRPTGEEGGFDFVYSIGVLHHLPDPRTGFLRLAGLLQPGGTIFVWVYSRENTGAARAAIEPLRRLASWLPRPLLRVFAWPLAAALHGAAKTYGLVERTAIARRNPLDAHLRTVADGSFNRTYAVVLDQLVAPMTAHISAEELREWFTAAGLEGVELSLRNDNSWRAWGRRPEAG
jgi:SAM-dependent methyltransferase